MLGAKGLIGAVRVEVLTDWPEHLDVGRELFVEGEVTARRVRRVERGGRVLVLHLAGVDSRETAESLAGRYLEVLPHPLPAGTYFWHQLEGLRVIDEAGAELGTLAEVFRAGEGEVYRVAATDGDLLLPALARIVLRIDLEAGIMIVRPDPEEIV